MEMMNQGYLMASGYGNNQPYEAASQSGKYFFRIYFLAFLVQGPSHEVSGLNWLS